MDTDDTASGTGPSTWPPGAVREWSADVSLTIMQALSHFLQSNTREGELYNKLDENRVQCYACGHRCPIPDGALGVCKVRYNRGGKLMVPWGYVTGAQCDPVEKKPFFHVVPGALAYSFGMLGCDFHCSYCQNWVTSQALRDPRSIAPMLQVTPERLVQEALGQGADLMVSTYNEPLITSEWAVDVFRPARKASLLTGFVSNGNATPDVLEYLRPWVDAYKVDLKGFDDGRYRKLGGRLQPVLDTIRGLRAHEFWIEIVTLLVPGFNDSPDELARLTEFIADVSPDIPWHVTAYHRDYKMDEYRDTRAADLLRAAEVGSRAGLRYVYAGNLPGRVDSLENTHCPDCRTLLVERQGYRILRNALSSAGTCPGCSRVIPGIWKGKPRTGGRHCETPGVRPPRSR